MVLKRDIGKTNRRWPDTGPATGNTSPVEHNENLGRCFKKMLTFFYVKIVGRR